MPATPSTPPDATEASLAWGLEALSFDDAGLAQGRLVVTQLCGKTADGSWIEAREVLTVALPEPGTAEEAAVFVQGGAAASPALTLQPVGPNALPIARLQYGGKAWSHDGSFVPPSRNVRASRLLQDWQHTVMALVETRAQALAARFGQEGLGEIADYLMLLALNPALAELRHLQSLPQVHPERLFECLARLHATVAPMMDRERLTPAIAPYVHGHCGPAFAALVAALRLQLSVPMSPQGARELAVQQRKFGIFTVDLDSGVRERSRLVVQVHSQLPAEALRTRLPSMVKVGPVESIRELVNQQLPGLALRPLAAAPRELPYSAGATYFEMDTEAALWLRTRASGHMALHVAGEFPGLTLAVWQIG